MKNNPISAIAGWKSAALLALVAMVAAVAFSGVLTNSNAADAQTEPSLSVTYDYTGTAGSVDATFTLADYIDATATPAIDNWNLLITAADGTTTLANCTSQTADATSAITLEGGARYTATAHSGASGDDCTSANRLDTLTITAPVATPSVDSEVNPGKTVDVTFAVPAGERRSLALSDDGATGSFSANGKATLTCTEGATAADRHTSCDLNEAVGMMTVRVAVGEDSKKGQHLYLSGRVTGDADTDLVLTVADPAPQPASFTVAPEKGRETAAAGTGTSTIVVTVMDDTTPVAKPYNGDVNVTFITPNGKVKCGEDDPANTCSTSSTDEEGKTTATLSDGVAGSSTITVLVGKLGAGSTEVTFFGPATNLAVDAGQSSINLGGGAFVTFTVTDADDRPVKGAEITQPPVDAVLAPDVEDAVEVAVALTDDEESDADDLPKGSPPYCGNDDGTDAKGQCVVRVSSAAEAPAAATRGDHTLNFQLVVDATDPDKTLTAEVVMTVAGPSDSISHDAPARIDTLDEIEVTLTVTDDGGNLVGTQPVSVTKVEGGGAILDQDESTSNGVAKFTFLASSLEGNVVFVVRSGDARAVINVAVGPEPMDDMDDDMSMATWNQPLASGTLNLVWNGEDGADPSAGAGEGVSAIWQWNGSSWDGYFPSAADVPGGNTLTSLSNGDAYFVIVE